MIKQIKLLALLAIVASLLWSVPAFAGKASLSEDDMDGITAAGEPKVIRAVSSTGANTVTFTEAVSFNAGWGGGAQQNLKALILNNIVGEQSIATALNIETTSQGTRGVSQTNSIDQSWGAELDFITGDPAPSVQGSGTQPSEKTFSGICVFGPCVTGSNASVTPNIRLSAFADLIILAVAPASSNTVTVSQANAYELDIGTTVGTTGAPTGSFQNGLAALVVNNALGQNLLATGWNIVGGSIGTATNNAAVVADSSLGQPFSVTQSNTSNQFRGAPIGWTTR